MIGDSKEQIEQCLNCTKPECTNCFGIATGRKTLVEVFLDDVERLCEQPLTDPEIGRVLGCSKNTVARCRKLLGIPCLKERAFVRAAGV